MDEVKVVFTKSEEAFRIVWTPETGWNVRRRNDRWYARLWRWLLSHLTK
jgi:hypothetical protein